MKWDPETAARAAGMKRAGFTNKQIAERLGKTISSVSTRFARTRLRRSPRVHAGRLGRLGLARAGLSINEEIAS